jgi:hypothetical protein
MTENRIFHTKSNNSGTAKVKIVKKAADKILKDSKKHNSSYPTT